MTGLRMELMKQTAAIILLTILLLVSGLQASDKKALRPGPKDKCPVCGMFVYKYPDFLARITFKDGEVAYFDGVKDMFKYYSHMEKYNPQKSRSDIDIIHVTDYYGVVPVDATKAFYVHGSDVYGPMGRELIPFGKEGEAREFIKDHKGKGLLRFQDVTDVVVKGLD